MLSRLYTLLGEYTLKIPPINISAQPAAGPIESIARKEEISWLLDFGPRHKTSQNLQISACIFPVGPHLRTGVDTAIAKISPWKYFTEIPRPVLSLADVSERESVN